MRKRIGIAVLLLAIALVVILPAFETWTRQPDDPTLGMSFSEVRPALQQRFATVVVEPGSDGNTLVYCVAEPSFFGRSRKLDLHFKEGRIVWVQSGEQTRKRCLGLTEH